MVYRHRLHPGGFSTSDVLFGVIPDEEALPRLNAETPCQFSEGPLIGLPGSNRFGRAHDIDQALQPGPPQLVELLCLTSVREDTYTKTVRWERAQQANGTWEQPPRTAIGGEVAIEQVIERAVIVRDLKSKGRKHRPKPIAALLLEAQLARAPLLESGLLGGKPSRPDPPRRLDTEATKKVVETVDCRSMMIEQRPVKIEPDRPSFRHSPTAASAQQND
nr:hypothetical protein [Curtobacterium ammoniigenes]